MKLTKRRVFGTLTVAALVAVFLSPPVYWRLVGWSRGEAFFEGRPTSYWSREARNYKVCRVYPCGDFLVPPPPYCFAPHLSIERPDMPLMIALTWIRAKIGMDWDLNWADSPIPFCDYKNSLPVLVELLDDENAKVRGLAAYTIRCMGQKGRLALDRLRPLTDDSGVIVDRVTVGEIAQAAVAAVTHDFSDLGAAPP